MLRPRATPSAPGFIFTDNFYKHPLTGPGKLAILRTSRLINREALHVLCAESRFRYKINCKKDYSDLPPQLFTERFRNVQFSIKLPNIHYMWPNPTHQLSRDGPTVWRRRDSVAAHMTDMFAGNSIPRDTLRIEFEEAHEETALMNTLFLPVLKQMTGFRTVIVGVTSPAIDPSRPAPVHRSGHHLWTPRRTSERYTALLREVKMELKPSLGPGELCDDLKTSTVHVMALFLVFHPREHLARAR